MCMCVLYLNLIKCFSCLPPSTSCLCPQGVFASRTLFGAFCLLFSPGCPVCWSGPAAISEHSLLLNTVALLLGELEPNKVTLSKVRLETSFTSWHKLYYWGQFPKQGLWKGGRGFSVKGCGAGEVGCRVRHYTYSLQVCLLITPPTLCTSLWTSGWLSMRSPGDISGILIISLLGSNSSGFYVLVGSMNPSGGISALVKLLKNMGQGFIYSPSGEAEVL